MGQGVVASSHIPFLPVPISAQGIHSMAYPFNTKPASLGFGVVSYSGGSALLRRGILHPPERRGYICLHIRNYFNSVL